MKEIALVIMAAGMASRFGGDKQVAPFGPNGEMIMDYSIHDAVKAGFNKVVFIIREEMYESFHETAGKRTQQKAEIAYAFQKQDSMVPGEFLNTGRQKPWGTAHAVMCADSVLSGPFGVINADDYYGPHSYKLLYDFLSNTSGTDCCLIGYRLGNTLSENGTVSRGVCETDGQGYLRSICERHQVRCVEGQICYLEDERWIPLAENTTASMNMFGMTKKAAEHLVQDFPAFLHGAGDILKQEYLLPAELGRLNNEEKISVRVLPTDDVWFGVTYRQDSDNFRRELQKLISEGLYPQNL